MSVQIKNVVVRGVEIEGPGGIVVQIDPWDYSKMPFRDGRNCSVHLRKSGEDGWSWHRYDGNLKSVREQGSLFDGAGNAYRLSGEQAAWISVVAWPLWELFLENPTAGPTISIEGVAGA